MLVEESKIITQMLQGIPQDGISPILNLGSSTLHYRQVDQAFMQENIFSPLDKMNISVVHSDLKSAEGVDLPGNIEDKDFRQQLKDNQFKVILANNLFEQVPNHLSFIELFKDIIPLDGYALISMPYLFPYHNDPIDNDWRPTPEEIAAVFGTDFKAVDGQISIEENNYFQFLVQRPKLLLITFIRIFTPFYKPKSWWNIVKYFPYIFKPFKASIVLLKRIHD